MRKPVASFRAVAVAGFSLAVLVVLRSPVQSQTGPMVGLVNMARVQQHARIVQAAHDQRAKERLDRQRLLERHGQFPLLVGDEAKRAVELDMKGVDRTPQEDQELIALRRKSSEMDLDHVKLIGRTNPSEQEVARRDELQAIRNKRSDEIDALRRQLEEELLQAVERLQNDVDARFAAALKATAERTGIQVILASHVLVPQPAVEGRPVDFRWESVVYYGGRDLTDDLIAVLNDGEATPLPGPQQQGTVIPGAVK